ncbi:MAG: alcohol dehydrogenase catalytic domain-containing protein [Firmicutes bacterium]|nr:alcohol dehydrogenase catalytic domain-containing protein [Bacillota bacterium]
MKALVYTGPGSMELSQWKKPKAKEGEVLVKVRAVGICGSDVEGYLGKTGRRIAPMIMGHEFSGEVVKVSQGSKFRVGDKVVVQPKLYCGSCMYCQMGLSNVCPNGEFLGVMSCDGAMAEYVAVGEQYVFRYGGNVTFEEASMVEPLAVAYRGVRKIDGDLADSFILVVGAGTIGLLVLQLLRQRGAENIIVSDLSDYRLEKARELGAAYTVNSGRENLMERIDELTSGRMVDYSFEAVGVNDTAADSLYGLRIGGTAVWIGNAHKMIEINMQRIVTTELVVRGTYIYKDEDYEECIKLIEQGAVDLKSIISLETDLENGPEVFRQLAENKDGSLLKVILKP